MGCVPQFAGLCILAVGIWLRVDPDIGDKLGGGQQLGNVHTGAYVLIALGAFISLVGFLGCCGAMKESQCMLVSVSTHTHTTQYYSFLKCND